MSVDFWVGLGIGLVGLGISLLRLIHQSRAPRLRAAFSNPAGDPAVLDCELTNTGRAPALELYISFRAMLPVATRVYAEAHVRPSLVESTTPPDPAAGPAAALLQSAFAVHLPRVAPRATVHFQVRTDDPDNIRAAAQLVRIRDESYAIIHEFGCRLRALDQTLGSLWREAVIREGRVKTDSFFQPRRLVHSHGEHELSYLSDDESIAMAHSQDLYARFKAELIDVFQGRPKFVAPVVRFKTAAGERTGGLFPPYVTSYLDISMSRRALSDRGKVVLYPPVPKSYQ